MLQKTGKMKIPLMSYSCERARILHFRESDFHFLRWPVALIPIQRSTHRCEIPAWLRGRQSVEKNNTLSLQEIRRCWLYGAALREGVPKFRNSALAKKVKNCNLLISSCDEPMPFHCGRRRAEAATPPL